MNLKHNILKRIWLRATRAAQISMTVELQIRSKRQTNPSPLILHTLRRASYLEDDNN